MGAEAAVCQPIPRMRTPAKIVAELKALDPGTEVTEHYVRGLVRDGAVPVVWAGSKALINLDDGTAAAGDSAGRARAECRRWDSAARS